MNGTFFCGAVMLLNSRDMVIVAWEWVREYLWLCFARIAVSKVCHKLGCVRDVVAMAEIPGVTGSSQGKCGKVLICVCCEGITFEEVEN